MNLKTISRRSLISLAIAGGLAIATSTAIAAQEAPFPLIVDLAWVKERAQRADLRLFDVSPLHVYRDRHIDSAEHAWWRDTVDPNYPVFGAVLTQGDEEAHRQRVLDSLHLLSGDQVVVYDNAGGFRAARLVWFLRFTGFPRVALLNAGYDEWKAAEFPIDSASSSSTAPIVDPQEGYYLVSEQLLARLDVPAVQIVDIRTDADRADDLDGNMPPGQIPGSLRLPWSELYNADGHLRSASEIAASAESLGLETARETVLYGTFGVDTALSWLALRNAGFETVLSYDRGWAEWSMLPGAPREPIT